MKALCRSKKPAFTLIELLATVLITVSLSTLSYVSLNNTLVNTSATTSTDGLTAEVKSQQLLAIAGKTDVSSTPFPDIKSFTLTSSDRSHNTRSSTAVGSS